MEKKDKIAHRNFVVGAICFFIASVVMISIIQLDVIYIILSISLVICIFSASSATLIKKVNKKVKK